MMQIFGIDGPGAFGCSEDGVKPEVYRPSLVTGQVFVPNLVILGERFDVGNKEVLQQFCALGLSPWASGWVEPGNSFLASPRVVL